MNVRVEELSPIRKKLYIEVDADVVSTELEKAYKKIAQTANVKGFRKGKVPKSILQQQYGPKAEYDASGPLINNSLYKALIDNDIEAVSQPEVVQAGAVADGQPYQYEAEVDVKPDVVAQNYTGLDLEKEKLDFDASAVETQLQQMVESKAQLEVTSRKKAREGDTVIIDFEGFIDGTAFDNGSASDYQLELGSNSFIPGFEDQLVGLKREQEAEINVTFPEAYGSEELAGKDAMFKVLVKEIKEKVIPKLNDEFAKEMDAESLDDLKNKVEENLLNQEKQRIDGQLQESLMQKLVENNPFDVPEGMITNQLHYLKDNFSQRLKSQGMSLEMLGMNDEAFNSSYREMAVQQVKGELILDAIARQEEIVAEEDDIDAKLNEFAEQSNTPMEQVKKYFENEQALAGLKGQVVQEKVSKFIQEHANITEVEAKSADAEVETTDIEEA